MAPGWSGTSPESWALWSARERVMKVGASVWGWRGFCWTQPPPKPEDSVWSNKDIWSRSGFPLGRRAATGRYSWDRDKVLFWATNAYKTRTMLCDVTTNSRFYMHQFPLLCRVWWWTMCTRRHTWSSCCTNTSSLCCMRMAAASTRDTECSECSTRRCSAVHPSTSTVSLSLQTSKGLWTSSLLTSAFFLLTSASSLLTFASSHRDGEWWPGIQRLPGKHSSWCHVGGSPDQREAADDVGECWVGLHQSSRSRQRQPSLRAAAALRGRGRPLDGERSTLNLHHLLSPVSLWRLLLAEFVYVLMWHICLTNNPPPEPGLSITTWACQILSPRWLKNSGKNSRTHVTFDMSQLRFGINQDFVSVDLVWSLSWLWLS